MTTFTIKPEIRKEIAEAIVKESHPGYDTRYCGAHYAVDTDGDNELDAVMLKGATAQWNPWSDGDTAIAVSDFYQDSGADFDPTPDPDLSDDEDAASEAAVNLALDELPTTYTVEEE